MKPTTSKLIVLLISFIAFSCSGSDDSGDEVVPEQEVGFKGRYTGTWNSTKPSMTYADYTVSLIIDFTGNDCDRDHVGQMRFRK